MLCGHKGALLTCGINRSLHDALCTPCVEGDILRRMQDILKTVRTPNDLLRTVVVHAEFIQRLCRDCVTHMQDTQQKLAGSNVPLAASLRDIL